MKHLLAINFFHIKYGGIMKKKSILFIGLFLLPAFLFSQNNTPRISKSVFFGKSKPLRETTIVLPGIHKDKYESFEHKFSYPGMQVVNPADQAEIQQDYGTIRSRGPVLNFEGVGNLNGIRPADPNGEPGPDHYLQSVNSSFAIWDKEGNLIFGPVDNQTLWESFPGSWEDDFWADPVFKYDHMADRWLVSSLSVDLVATDSHYTMLAVSVSPDPLGEYYCYAFEFEDFNDYPKVAIWPDGYYITYNMYEGSNPSPEAFLYSLVTVIDREAMLAGVAEVTMIEFEIPDPDTERFFPMAADMRGMNINDESPCYVITVDNHMPEDPWHLSLDVYEFQTDWQEPSNSVFDIVSQFDLGTFESMNLWGPGAPQKGSDINIITIPLYLMYPVTYRIFEDHVSMVCCQTVWDGDIHYIKWYELRKEDADWYMYQTGNYAPGDYHYFCPSISMNGNGDIAMGYTISNEDTYTCLKLTGRRAEDPPGTMTFEELSLYNGLNYANTYLSYYDQNMWGDYAAMMVDPVDDSTFWFTHMYTKAITSFGNWATRIFKINLSGEPASPFADAGNDTLTCNTPFFTTQGFAENYSSIVWTTGGDGNFIQNNSLNASYLRGPGDMNNRQVTLTMHLTGYEPGMEAADSMILYINKDPEVYAGPDVTINSEDVVPLQGEVNFAYEYFWTTMGDGSFTDSTLLDPIYTPGPEDIISEAVTLVLTAKEVSPCTGSASDSLIVYISTAGMDDVPGNRMILNLFPNPTAGIITLQAERVTNDQLTVQVVGGDGKVIFTGRFHPDNNNFEIQMDLSYLNPGIYFVRLQAANITKTTSILLIK